MDPDRDHIRGAEDAPVTLLEYGDYECPYCGQAEVAIRELLDSFGDELRYVWRHLPLNDVHPHAQMAAEAAEAAAAQGAFWGMHDKLLEQQDELTSRDLTRYAEELGLDVAALLGRASAPRVHPAPGRGRGERGRERRGRHAELLHQRRATTGPTTSRASGRGAWARNRARLRDHADGPSSSSTSSATDSTKAVKIDSGSMPEPLTPSSPPGPER